MANSEILGAILHSYMYLLKLKLDDNQKYEKLTFKFIAQTQLAGRQLPINEWHIEFLKYTLLYDGFLELSFPESLDILDLTPLGIKAAQNGHYKKSMKDKFLEEEIKKETLKNFRRSQYSLFISIITLIISAGISIYNLFGATKYATLDQIMELKQRIDLIENFKYNTTRQPKDSLGMEKL